MCRFSISTSSRIALSILSAAALLSLSACREAGTGIFESAGDIGGPIRGGETVYRPSSDTYRVTGGGENIWFESDAFHFAWREVEGDLSMTAEIVWAAEGGNEHKKAGWMVRGGLEPDDPYVDAMIHGDGLIALQYRKEKGGETAEIPAPFQAPATIRFERTGDVFALSIAQNGGAFQPAGSIEIPLGDPVFAGLAVTSHDSTATETALFSSVSLDTLGAVSPDDRVVESTLEIINVDTRERRIVYRAKEHFEAPNWHSDGYLLFNQSGRLYTIPVDGSTAPEMLDTGFADRCNNDHGISFDGTRLAISHGVEGKGSIIFVLPIEGGTPEQVTENGPSYWHGWSPDGQTLTYCARRGDNYDVYTIPVDGGRETRLTTAEGLDDGPEYSPDGRYIYFNSVRSGKMKIWRMSPDGSNQEQVTFGEETNDWFAHPSPDGERLIMISYDDSVPPGSHPANKNVSLRLMDVDGGEPETVAQFFGGQGTINVPSWSPDSREVAFVSYRLVAP